MTGFVVHTIYTLNKLSLFNGYCVGYSCKAIEGATKK